MFDIGWTELLVVAMVAILVVGPKELPRMLRGFGKTVGNLRRMANEFQGQFNEALREAEQQAGLDDLKSSMPDLSDIDPMKDIKEAIDPLNDLGNEIDSAIKSGPAPPPETKLPETELPETELPGTENVFADVAPVAEAENQPPDQLVDADAGQVLGETLADAGASTNPATKPDADLQKADKT